MKPDRIFLVRHGESQGNVNKEIYKDVPDYALQLTERGHTQANDVGVALRTLLGDESVQFYVSPFWRTRQTYVGIRNHFDTSRCKYYEDPRLREQEWGQDMKTGRDAYKNGLEEERDLYGHFYYRFANGESCADVFDRVSDFMGTMYRDFKKKDFPRNAIIVTHGMTMRLFIMRWFHCSVEEFESWGNPKNCQYYQLDRQDDEKYALVTPLKTHSIRHSHQFPFYNFRFRMAPFKGDMFPFPHILPYESESGQSTNQP